MMSTRSHSGDDRAFTGLRVLDFSTTIAGPQCSRMLADLGAEVVKIESPEGDMMRSRPPKRGGASSAFGQLNAGKKSVALDLRAPGAIEAVYRLAEASDIVVENFRPGVMQRLKLGYSTLSALNPALIYCSISGYGQTGPSSQLPAYAPVIHAASGYDIAHMHYQHGRERPDYCGIFVADVVSGVYAFGAIGAALHQRHATGRGQHIDLSMLESMLSLTLNEIQGAQFRLPPPGRPLFGPVRTADGYVMIAVASEKSFRSLVQAAGQPELVSDPRFRDYAERRARWDELMDIVEAWTGRLDSAECLRQLAAHGVPCSPYRSVAEALEDPQIAHRGALAEVRDAGGTFRALNPPFRMSASGTGAGSRASALGEHTREVLRSVGLSDTEIDALMPQGEPSADDGAP
jgi:crotonobetainyl-CoA:carnitine CoA-transferase CaiB-like acyl-CoA transferase